ncbi:MAG: OsmC family protein [Candidatus Nitrosocosmicus sp.]
MNNSTNETTNNGVNTNMLKTLYESLHNNPSEMTTTTFYVRSEWNGGFGVTSSSKNFSLGGRTMERNTEFKMNYDFPIQFSGEGKGPTVCEVCMGSLAACLIQTIVAHATSKGILIDNINIDVEGDVNLRGFTGIDSNVRPGAQQFRVNLEINSNTASKEQINELYEIGKKFSPAFDTLTNGTSVVIVGSE